MNFSDTQIVSTLPVFDSSLHLNSRVFALDDGIFYFGGSRMWVPLNGIVLELNAGENISKGQPVYLSALNTVMKASSSSESTSNVIGVAAETRTTGQSITIFGDGCVLKTALIGATYGTRYYLSETAGVFVTTLTTENQRVQVGFSINATDFKVSIEYNTETNVTSGTIAFWPDETPPDGWLECDGSALYSGEYLSLYNAIGDLYGNGIDNRSVGSEGNEDFNIPDYRGLLLRGVDGGAGVDENAEFDRFGTVGNSETFMTGSSIDDGDNLGTYQAAEMKDHYHKGSFIWNEYPGATHNSSSGIRLVFLPHYNYSTSNRNYSIDNARNISLMIIIKI